MTKYLNCRCEMELRIGNFAGMEDGCLELLVYSYAYTKVIINASERSAW